jgi:dTDP-4-dehydrorhamnose 3,5-epimerase
VEYKCTALYDQADELGIAYDDPSLAIPWPAAQPILSDRDRRHPRLHEVMDQLPLFEAQTDTDPRSSIPDR